MHDWTMLDLGPALARSYLTPSAFIYYLPSLLLGCLGDLAYVDHALEAIMPSNRARLPKGQWWWFAFVEELTRDQRGALSAYVEHVRLLLQDGNEAGLAYACEATAIWPCKV